MRQGGMKPKSHKNGTYWVRANANNGGKKKELQPEKENVPIPIGYYIFWIVLFIWMLWP